MKRYQFELNGEIVYKNVSPGNEDMFFNKYGMYNPTLVSDEVGKSQGTSQSQNNQQENTESNLEDGSLESPVVNIEEPQYLKIDNNFVEPSQEKWDNS